MTRLESEREIGDDLVKEIGDQREPGGWRERDQGRKERRRKIDKRQ